MDLLRIVILDTNFLMVPGLFGVDIISEIKKACDFPYELAVLDKSIDELNKIIKEQTGKDALSAKLAKQLIDKFKIRIIRTVCDDDYVDDILVKYDKNHIVATNDIKLIHRLKLTKIPVLRLRQKKYIILEK